jgi:hypothetical protein
MKVKWSEIEAECGDYRAGFIATFRKYEGKPTDEKDGQGRTVKVTGSSFARHMGIPVSTFQDWVNDEQHGGDRRPAQDMRRARSSVKRMNDEEKATLAAEIVEELDESERLAIAQVAMTPAMRDEERGHKEREAHRESKPIRERGYVEMISHQLDRADLDILEATKYANQTTWDDSEVTTMMEGRIDRTAMRLDLLRMAVRSEGDIDAELAKIEEMD